MSVKWSDIDSQGTPCPFHFNGATFLQNVVRDSGKWFCLAEYFTMLTAGRHHCVGYMNDESEKTRNEAVV
jgi:hypothetical protein